MVLVGQAFPSLVMSFVVLISRTSLWLLPLNKGGTVATAEELYVELAALVIQSTSTQYVLLYC